MTKIKLCGLSGIEEIEAANELKQNTSDLYLLQKADAM